MKVRPSLRFFSLFVILISLLVRTGGTTGSADPVSTWWDDNWPYRIPVTVSNAGPVVVSLNFSTLFSQLGLPGALIDLDSIRVVPIIEGIPGDPVPHDETYSVMLIDGDSLNLDPSLSEPYWDGGDQAELSLETEQKTQGTGSIKAVIQDKPDLSPHPGINFIFNQPSRQDWSAYEALTADIWPEVNESAMDQAPDLFHLELLGLENCPATAINGPALALSRWNRVNIALSPFGRCHEPDLSQLSGLHLFLRTNPTGLAPGYFEDGDQVTLYLDRLRGVDQDGGGEIRWIAQEQVTRYEIYFDTINHAGHPQPVEAEISTVPSGSAIVNPVETGGYFHLVTDTSTQDLVIWEAPTLEKIFKAQPAPVVAKPIMISAARGESESLQLVIHSSGDQTLPVHVSDLVNGDFLIPSDQVSIFRVDYVPLSTLSDSYGRLTDWPDPLYPLLPNQPVFFPAGTNQPLWFRIRIPVDAQTGNYQATITVGAVEIPITLQVWHFQLPQSFALQLHAGFDWAAVRERYGGSVDGIPQDCAAMLDAAVQSVLADYHLDPISPTGVPGEVWLQTLTAFESEKAHNYRMDTGHPVWWEMTGRDHPPMINPVVMDRPGLEARALPWLAWVDRVGGLYYQQVVDWDADPWLQPYSNATSNGDGYLFYPPNDSVIGADPCIAESNRFIPSIRLELLREGMEDFALLELVETSNPRDEQKIQSRALLESFFVSRTSLYRSPLALQSVREALAQLISEKSFPIYIPLHLD